MDKSQREKVLIIQQLGAHNDLLNTIVEPDMDFGEEQEYKRKIFIETLENQCIPQKLDWSAKGGKHVMDPVKDVQFYYTPTMQRQAVYLEWQQKKVISLSFSVNLIHVFATSGKYFGLHDITVFVEVKESQCGDARLWAEVYYVADSQVPEVLILLKEHIRYK